MSDLTPFARNLDLTNEDAYVLGTSLEGVQIEEINGCTIYSGRHSEYGNIHVVIPAMGDAKALLPFDLKPVVLQSF
jgi:hypothetical protein